MIEPPSFNLFRRYLNAPFLTYAYTVYAGFVIVFSPDAVQQCMHTSWSSATMAVNLRRLRCAVIGGTVCLCLFYLYHPAYNSDELGVILFLREKSYAISIKHKFS